MAANDTPPLTIPIPKSKYKKSRCSFISCNKKVNLIGFSCKCNDTFLFCSKHLNNHECQYNYHKEAQLMIASNNPVVIPKKIDKIN